MVINANGHTKQWMVILMKNRHLPAWEETRCGLCNSQFSEGMFKAREVQLLVFNYQDFTISNKG